MNKAQSALTSPPAAPALDPAEAERAGRMLDRLAEMAMERAEAMHAACLAAIKAGDAAAVAELELSLDRTARGIRHSLALKAHLARMRQEMADRAAAGALARDERKDQRRREVARLVTRAIAAKPGRTADIVRSYANCVWQYLLEKPEFDAALALTGQPIEEIVIRLCRQMEVEPDLVLAEEAPAAAEDEMLPIPPQNPEWWRYCRIIPTADQRQAGEQPYWWDVKLQQRIDRPPWDKGGG